MKNRFKSAGRSGARAAKGFLTPTVVVSVILLLLFFPLIKRVWSFFLGKTEEEKEAQDKNDAAYDMVDFNNVTITEQKALQVADEIESGLTWYNPFKLQSVLNALSPLIDEQLTSNQIKNNLRYVWAAFGVRSMITGGKVDLGKWYVERLSQNDYNTVKAIYTGHQTGLM